MEIDAAWKRLFALPAMVEHLLRAVAPELARRLDFTAMEQLAANWTRPTGSAEPGTGTHPTGSAEPHSGARPTGSAEPGTGTRPTGSAEPGTGTRPTGGAEPGTGADPTGSAEPHSGARPTGGAEPGTGTRPTGGAEPGTGADPTGSAEPHSGARPTGSAEPGTGAHPTGGADPHTGTRPTGGTEPHTGARPAGAADPHTGTRPTGGANPRTSTQRYADAVWRIRYADADAGDDARTLVLLLEFQSTVDPDMAARTLIYTGLLREHLRRQGKFDPDGGLRTLAVVVYSGPKPWLAADAADAVPLSPDGTPLMTVVAPYRLLDSRRAATDDSTERNPALAVLGVEGTTSPAQAAARMQAMALWLPQVLTDRDVRREFGASVVAWLAATMPRLFPSADGEEIESIGLGLFEEDEMTTLHLRVKEWEAEWLRQGIAQGMERGLEQGMEQGMERGLAQGVEQGMERGLAQERSLLCEIAARKFGAAVGEALARRLESASDAEALRDIGVLIIDCTDGAELLARIPPHGDA